VAGQPVTATINLTNSGNSSKDFLADPRLVGRIPQLLLGTDTNNVGLPLSLSAQPNWLVPPDTNQLTTVAQGNVPIGMDTQIQFGDPDFGGPSFGNAVVNRLNAPEVAPSFYFALPEPTGPFGANGTPAGSSANLAAVANTNPFDETVAPSTGDVWAQTVDPNAAPYAPLTLAPGQSGTITLTFTPSGRRGHVVRGFIGLDSFNPVTASGDEIATIPYRYRIR
jgi:hypothetical protein